MNEQQASEITQWLEQQGLGALAPQFIEHEIDWSLLPTLSEQDLQELGLKIGQRRRFALAVAGQFPGAVPAEIPAAVPAAVAPADTLERRQLTVLFCDMVGATQLSSHLDPEDLRALMHGYYKVCQQAIVQQRGFIASYLGDGLLSYFGYPEAHEGSVEAGIRAALSIIEAVGQLKAADGSPLSVRLGMATGMAVVGDLIGEGPSEMRQVIGQTPNLAARIQGLAPAGTLWIAESTRALAKGQFDYRDEGVHLLKGIDTPVQLWQVLGETRPGSRFDALHPDPQQCIGREHEIERLARHWQHTHQGQSQVVQILGEAGLGKSRLIKSLEDRLNMPWSRQWLLQCGPEQSSNPLHPLITALRLLLQLQPDSAAPDNPRRIAAWLGPLGDDENVALLANLFGLAPGLTVPLKPLSAEQKKARTLNLLVDICRHQAAQHPILILVEDAHWIDAMTQRFIEAVAAELLHSRLMLLVTARPEYRESLPHADTQVLELPRLNRGQAEQVVLNQAGEHRLPKDTVAQIVERAEGNPLYLEELTKAVIDHLRFGVRSDLLSTIIPASLHDSLMGRLDRLGKAKEAAQVASCLGRRFAFGFLCELMERDAPTVALLLGQLLDAQLIVQEGGTLHGNYAFKHALLHDVAYQSLLRGKRRALHQRVVELIETRHPDLALFDPGHLAHHCRLGGLAEKEAFYLVASARAATRLMAVREALANLERAESLLSELPPSPQVIADHTAVIQALMDTGRFIILPTRLIELSNKVRERQSKAGLLQDPRAQVPLLFQEARAHLYTGNYPQARQILESLHALGLRHHDTEVAMKPGSALTMTLNCQGDFAASLAFIHSGNIGYYSAQHNLIDYLAGLGWCGHAYCQTGQMAEGLRCNELAIQESDQLGSAIYGAGAYLWKCHALLACRHHPEAVQAAHMGVELARASDVPYLVWHGLVLLAFSHARSGDHSGATQHLDQAREMLARFPMGQICLQDYLPMIEAEMACLQGDWARTLRLGEQAVAASARCEGLFSQALAERALAMAHLLGGAGLEPARQHALRAFALMQRGGAVADFFYSSLLWARGLQRAGHPKEARPWLQQALTLAERHGFDPAHCEYGGSAALRQT